MVDSVRVQVIDSSVKLDDFMKFAQLERELQVRLQDELKIQTARLEALKVINSLCVRMKEFQRKYHFKTADEFQKRINKEARFC